MNDKEREVERLTKILDGDSLLRHVSKDLAERIIELGYRHASDRVAERFTEEEALKWIQSWAKLAEKPYEGHWEDLAYWLTVYRDEELARKAKLTVHQPDPVPVEDDWDPDWKYWLNCKLPNLPDTQAAIFSRIQSDRAALEGEVLSLRRLLESETERIGRDLMRWKNTAEGETRKADLLRAELDTLKANSIAVDWKAAPYWAVGVKGFWVVLDKSLHHTDLEFAYIPRPIPETREMTPDQKAQKWVDKFKVDAGYTESTVGADAAAWANLTHRLLGGCTIDELMSEANLPTTTEVK